MSAASPAQDQIRQLLSLAAPAERFRSTDSQAWASLPLARFSQQIVPICSSRFRDWLLARFLEKFHHPPSLYALRHALRSLAASALATSRPRQPVWQRLGGDSTSLTLDLANGNVVEISSRGWELAYNSGSFFRHTPQTAPLPDPVPGASLDDLRDSLRLPPDAWQACQHWIFAALRPSGPYPILIIQGPPGRSRTTLARRLRSLLDPSLSPAAELPRSPRAWLRLAYENRILLLDHLRQLTPLRSEMLCRIADGAGFTLREHYSEREPLRLQVCCPIILTVTQEFSPDAELAARAIFLQLPADHQPIPEPEWEQARPRLLGALCTALTQALEPDPLDTAPQPLIPNRQSQPPAPDPRPQADLPAP